MKTRKILISIMILLANTISFAQTDKENQSLKEFKQPPKSTEIVVDIITQEQYAGDTYDEYEWDSQAIFLYIDRKSGKDIYKGDYVYKTSHDNTKDYSDEELLQKLMDAAKQKYKETYPGFSLRDFKCKRISKPENDLDHFRNRLYYTYKYSASVVISDPKLEANENLSMAIDKAFRNIRQGSRIAIDQVTVWEEIDRDDYKDKLIDVLLNKGYKVVAKEYLEKLYEEQQKQQSGIYNDRTIVQENNFSAVGYYINVKVTKTSLRVQVVNVSTGEYDGNATINF